MSVYFLSQNYNLHQRVMILDEGNKLIVGVSYYLSLFCLFAVGPTSIYEG